MTKAQALRLRPITQAQVLQRRSRRLHNAREFLTGVAAMGSFGLLYSISTHGLLDKIAALLQ